MAANMNPKEVITLQVGNYSNFIGAHFWNLHESFLKDKNIGEEVSEVDHGILYREGQDINGDRTCKPRVICLDLKENISSVQNSEDLAECSLEGGVLAWHGSVEKYDRTSDNPDNLVKDLRDRVHSASQMISNLSQRTDFVSPRNCGNTDKCRRLEGVFSSWLDYSLVRFHHKSVHVVESSDQDCCNILNNFGRGELLFRRQSFRDDFEDKLHFFAEECDNLQGFQIFTDIHNCFGGLTSGILQDLAEDYAKKSQLCFASMPATFPDDSRQAADQRMLNIMLGFARYIESSSQVIPLSLRNSFGLRHTGVVLPWIDYKATLGYHTSAILATAIDTATVPYRLITPQGIDMNALIGCLSIGGRKISALSAAIPIPVSSTFALKEVLKGYGSFASNFTSLTQDVKPRNILAESAVIRGVPSHLLKPADCAKAQRELSLILQSGSKQYLPYSHNYGYIVQEPCTVTPPFPDFFKPCVTQVGCVVDHYQRPQELGVHRTSVMTSLQNCEEVSNLLEVLLAGVKQKNIIKCSGLLEASIEEDDIKCCVDDLHVMAQAYHSEYEL